MNVCNEHTLCSFLSEYIEVDDSKPGFHLWRKVENSQVVMKGVIYKHNGKKPILINRCPFCEAKLNWFAP